MNLFMTRFSERELKIMREMIKLFKEGKLIFINLEPDHKAQLIENGIHGTERRRHERATIFCNKKRP
jgi:succinylglutamate desuccinylase